MESLVAVVLLNYNQNEFTLKCIDSLLQSDYGNYKILLVDNGSEKENVKQLELKLPETDTLIFEKIKSNMGYGQGTNHGLEVASKMNPDYYLIMNNDTIIDPKAISAMVEASELYHGMARVTGKVYRFDDPGKFEDVGSVIKNKRLLEYSHLALNQIDNNQFEKIEERDMIDDVFVMQSSKFMKDVGGYSKDLWINGVNLDLGLRALENGYKLIYTPHAKLWHKGSLSIGGRKTNPKTAFWNVQSQLIIRYKYLNILNFSIVYLRVLLNSTRTFIKYLYLRLFKGVNIRDYALAKFKGIAYFHKWVLTKNENTGYNPYIK